MNILNKMRNKPEKNFDLKIGFKCNNDCRHCVIANKKSAGELSFEQIRNIIDGLDSDVTGIVLTGGEPSISPHLLDILSYIKKKNYFVIVQTNATGFADSDFCKECSKYINHALVAIHSCNPEVHDNIVRSKGMWYKTIEGFKNLSNNGVFIETQTVLSKYNIMTAYDTYKMIQELRPGTLMNMTYPHMMGNAWNNREDVCFRYSDYKDEFQRILKDFSKYIFSESIPYCYLYPYQDSIAGCLENDILMQSYGRVGVDFSDGLFEKNYNILDIKERRKAPRCKDCVFNNDCIGVWKEYIEMFKSNLDLFPIKEI